MENLPGDAALSQAIPPTILALPQLSWSTGIDSCHLEDAEAHCLLNFLLWDSSAGGEVLCGHRKLALVSPRGAPTG